MNKYLKIIYPTLLAVAVVIGILLGTNIQQKTAKPLTRSVNLFQPDKISLLLKLVEKDYVDSINNSDIIEKVIPEILNELDPHSTYIPASEMKAVNEDMRGNFSGIGVQFVMQNDTVMITDVLSGGPSKNLGIMAGDRIVNVNGQSIAGESIKSDSIVSMLRGKKGTLVNVTIYRPGFSDLLEFDIIRGDIPLFSIDVAYMITDKIGLIRVNRFSETTYQEFVKGINTLTEKGLQKLIIDLRGNAGGSLQAVIQMVDEFLPANQLIVYTEGKSRTRYNYNSSSRGMWKEKEVAVLIDEFSASASEIFAGAIQDNDRGLVIGRRSYGKGLVQEQIPLFDGSAIRLTVARFYTPSGRSIQKPYDNGNEAYRMDYHNRIINNELSQKDSIHFNDSLKYYTTGGRPVYGGGGIMPDFFIPVDTSGINNFFSAIASRNLVYHFAFDYADKHRAELSIYEEVDQLDEYLSGIGLLNQFIAHAKEKGVKFSQKEYNESKTLLKAQLHAYVCRNILGNNGFYPIIFKIDKTVEKALELLEKEWNAKEIGKVAEAVQL